MIRPVPHRVIIEIKINFSLMFSIDFYRFQCFFVKISAIWILNKISKNSDNDALSMLSGDAKKFCILKYFFGIAFRV